VTVRKTACEVAAYGTISDRRGVSTVTDAVSTATGQQLLASWRDGATTLRQRGVTGKATLLEQCADQLEEYLTTCADTALTIANAAAECGYSTGHLRRLVSQGILQDVGTNGVTLVRRADLPQKAGMNRNPLPLGTLSPI